VDFVVEKFKIRAQGIIDAIVGLIVLGFTGVFTWNAFKYATTSMDNNQVSSTTQTPLYIFIYLMAACFLLFCFVYLIRIIQSVRKARLK
jgi:TRAP-type C4-dicarboxylate transport system permease small subunit